MAEEIEKFEEIEEYDFLRFDEKNGDRYFAGNVEKVTDKKIILDLGSEEIQDQEAYRIKYEIKPIIFKKFNISKLW